jgi:hypothetical protein
MHATVIAPLQRRNLKENETTGGMNEAACIIFAEGKVSKKGSRFCTDDPGKYIAEKDGNTKDVCTVMSHAPDGMT